jgi:hypothetical protein
MQRSGRYHDETLYKILYYLPKIQVYIIDIEIFPMIQYIRIILIITHENMKEILRFNTIAEYNALNNTETLHPLVSLVHFKNAEPRKLRRMYYGPSY